LPLLFLSKSVDSENFATRVLILLLHALAMAGLPLLWNLASPWLDFALFIDLLLAGGLIRPAIGRQPGRMLKTHDFLAGYRLWPWRAFGLSRR